MYTQNLRLKSEEGEQGTTVDPLRYQHPDQNSNENKPAFSTELLSVKFRYKAPDQDESKLIEWANQSKGRDENRYRAEYIRLVEMAKAIYK